MNAIDKKKRMGLTHEIEDMLEQNCRLCPERNAYYHKNKFCQKCPVLKKLQEKGVEMGWKDTLVVVHDYPEEFIKLAKSNGIDRNVFNLRVQNNGWSYEEAATIPKRTVRSKTT